MQIAESSLQMPKLIKTSAGVYEMYHCAAGPCRARSMSEELRRRHSTHVPELGTAAVCRVVNLEANCEYCQYANAVGEPRLADSSPRMPALEIKIILK